MSNAWIICIGSLLVVVVLLASCVNNIARPFRTPDVSGLDSKLTSMPCVTWVDSEAEGGKIAVRGPMASYRIGVSPDCTASEVENIVVAMDDGVDDTEAWLESWALFVSDSDEVQYSAFSDNVEVAMLSGDGALSREEFQFLASNWVRLQKEVDPKSQMYSRKEYSEDSPKLELRVGIVINLSPEELDRASSIIPAELKSGATHWKITSPTTGTMSDRANDHTAGRILLDTHGQLPDKDLVGLGRAASTAWEGDTPDGTYVTVSSEAWGPNGESKRTIGIAVCNVSDSQVSPWSEEILQQTPVPIDQTTLWPHLTSMIDRLVPLVRSSDWI